MIESTLEPLFHITSLPKYWTISDVDSDFVITNNNLELESFSLYESICDADRLDFGRCTSARVTFTCLDINVSLMNRTFDISFVFDGDESETPFSVGRYTVIEDKPSLDRRSRDVVLQDALYFVLNTNYASWYNSLTWTNMTLGSFIDSFLTHVGINKDTASRNKLVNANMPLSKTVDTNELLGSTILYSVCQIAGCFGVINREGNFKFLYLVSDIEGLYPANDLYPADDLYPIEPPTTRIDESEYFPPLVYEEYRTQSITKLHIYASSDDAGTYVGSGDVVYDIAGNFLLSGMSASSLTTYLTNTLNTITKCGYRPYSVSKMGNLCFEVGDAIRVSNDAVAVESYILTRTFTGFLGFTDDISAEGLADLGTAPSTADSSIQQVNKLLHTKTLKLRSDIDEVSAELSEQLDSTHYGSYAWQTAREIGAKVEVTEGNFTTGFSWLLNSSGHTWYAGSKQVMKIDSTGLTVTGKVEGSSFECKDSRGNVSTLISSDGSVAHFADYLVSFDGDASETDIDTNTLNIRSDTVGFDSEDVSITTDTFSLSIGGYVGISGEVTRRGSYGETGLYIGCESDGSSETDYVGINAIEWVHIGVNTPSISIGSQSSTDVVNIRGASVKVNGNNIATASEIQSQINSLVPSMISSAISNTVPSMISSAISTALSNLSTLQIAVDTTSYGNINFKGGTNAASVSWVNDNFQRKE